LTLNASNNGLTIFLRWEGSERTQRSRPKEEALPGKAIGNPWQTNPVDGGEGGYERESVRVMGVQPPKQNSKECAQVFPAAVFCCYRRSLFLPVETSKNNLRHILPAKFAVATSRGGISRT
jgi:hypothetical protein